jgi:hypothetical protein
MSAVALFFSWQANQIASKQITDNVMSPSASYTWAMYEQDKSQSGHHHFVCDQRIRLSNLGGAGTSVIRYDAFLNYKETEVKVSGEQEYPLTSGKGDIFSGLEITFVSDYKQNDTEKSLFPVQIPPYSTVDVWTRASFTIDKVLASGDYFYPPYDFYQFLQSGAEYSGLYPVEVSYIFTMASGKTVTTPKALCIFLKYCSFAKRWRRTLKNEPNYGIS